jgi:hypothetical protein
MAGWLGFNVALPLAPILLVRFAAYLFNVNKRLLVILRDGQLCFFSSALAAVAVNDVVYRTQPGAGDGTTTGLAIVGLVMLIAFSMFVYGLAVVRDEVQRLTDHKVAWTSILIAVVAISMVLGIRWNLGLLG